MKFILSFHEFRKFVFRINVRHVQNKISKETYIVRSKFCSLLNLVLIIHYHLFFYNVFFITYWYFRKVLKLFRKFLERGLISVVRMVPKLFETILMKHFCNTFIIFFLKVRCGIFENVHKNILQSRVYKILLCWRPKNKPISIVLVEKSF